MIKRLVCKWFHKEYSGKCYLCIDDRPKNKCCWCNQDEVVRMPLDRRYMVSGSLARTDPVMDAYEQYICQEFLFACEGHRYKLYELSYKDIPRQLAKKDKYVMSFGEFHFWGG